MIAIQNKLTSLDSGNKVAKHTVNLYTEEIAQYKQI